MGHTDSTFNTSKDFLPRPPKGVLRPPDWPPRPDVFDEVTLGPFVSKTAATLAYRVWSAPDQALGEVWKRWGQDPERPFERPYPRPPNDLDLHVLANNVYEHLMSDPLLPIPLGYADQLYSAQGLDQRFAIGDVLEPMREKILDECGVGDLSSWSIDAVRSYLKKRKLSTRGKRAELESRVYDYELGHFCGMMPRSNLSTWGMEQEGMYRLQPSDKSRMSALEMYTFAIHLSPYNPTYWVSRAYCHYLLGFFDLAIGDAHRGRLLCDVLEQSEERNRRPGLYPRIWHAIEQHLLAEPRQDGNLKPEVVRMRKQNGINAFVPTLQKALHNTIILSLAALNSWEDFDNQNKILAYRLGMPWRDRKVPKFRAEVTRTVSQSYIEKNRKRQRLFFHEGNAGAIVAEKRYPFEDKDIRRSEQMFLEAINENIFQGSEDPPFVSSCMANLSHSGGLGVFAVENIRVNQLIYYEEPTIRGHLPPRRMKNDQSNLDADQARCDNCMKILKKAPKRSSRIAPTQAEHGTATCECFDIWTRKPGTHGPAYCKPDKSNASELSCLQIARNLHHFSSCGKDWRWLYDTMRPVIQEWKKLEHISHTNEIHGTMLSLLLKNVFEITLHRRQYDPQLNAHEIDELLVLDGGSESWRASYFPFNMAANIIVPFDILTCLGVDIFRDLTFDTWVIQIILRKLLVNAVPWDSVRQGEVPDRYKEDSHKKIIDPAAQDERIQAKKPFDGLDPSFMNLYLFPGLGLFNHSCRGENNAEWGYDPQVPNRILIWATKDISAEDEIRIRYRHNKIKSRRCAMRFFGELCKCDSCTGELPNDSSTEGSVASDESQNTSYEIDGDSESDSERNFITSPSESPHVQSLAQDLDTERKEYFAVEDDKVVIYRSLEGPPALSGNEQRKRRADEQASQNSMGSLFSDFSGDYDHEDTPEEAEERARKIRVARETMRERFNTTRRFKEAEEAKKRTKEIGKRQAKEKSK
ncbi:hypothetical protein N7462_006197 [Penicillium macrosclerotiorum]|uniref:uncharacterized protein n=1 Tax=Penicillium macrosclerotiorum TaxID=303699 RepID=UPI002547F453|nr:uncharacterized protein N7462_006197 [Penicillium macrosclerotiorum]KAJ5683032.1 hypothetical protein N7462_006197 [Penicillium macrosclerotiorum]